MLEPSFKTLPVAPVFFDRSEPARSTKFSLELRLVSRVTPSASSSVVFFSTYGTAIGSVDEVKAKRSICTPNVGLLTCPLVPLCSVFCPQHPRDRELSNHPAFPRMFEPIRFFSRKLHTICDVRFSSDRSLLQHGYLNGETAVTSAASLVHVGTGDFSHSTPLLDQRQDVSLALHHQLTQSVRKNRRKRNTIVLGHQNASYLPTHLLHVLQNDETRQDGGFRSIR